MSRSSTDVDDDDDDDDMMMMMMMMMCQERIIDQRRVDVSTGVSKVSCNEMCVSVGRSVGLSTCFLSGCADVLF